MTDTPRNREQIENWKQPHAPWRTGQILEMQCRDKQNNVAPKIPRFLTDQAAPDLPSGNTSPDK